MLGSEVGMGMMLGMEAWNEAEVLPPLQALVQHSQAIPALSVADDWRLRR